MATPAPKCPMGSIEPDATIKRTRMAYAAVPTYVTSMRSQPVPATLASLLSTHCLSEALAGAAQGRAVSSVETVEVIKTVATKVRFAVSFEGSEEKHSFCLKGLLDVDEMTARGGATCVLEGDFYARIAPKLNVRVP